MTDKLFDRMVEKGAQGNWDLPRVFPVDGVPQYFCYSGFLSMIAVLWRVNRAAHRYPQKLTITIGFPLKWFR